MPLVVSGRAVNLLAKPIADAHTAADFSSVMSKMRALGVLPATPVSAGRRVAGPSAAGVASVRSGRPAERLRHRRAPATSRACAVSCRAASSGTRSALAARAGARVADPPRLSSARASCSTSRTCGSAERRLQSRSRLVQEVLELAPLRAWWAGREARRRRRVRGAGVRRSLLARRDARRRLRGRAARHPPRRRGGRTARSRRRPTRGPALRIDTRSPARTACAGLTRSSSTRAWPRVDRLRGEAARLVEARGPQPLVEADARRATSVIVQRVASVGRSRSASRRTRARASAGANA